MIMRFVIYLIVVGMSLGSALKGDEVGVHLFVLSGQSNMAAMDPKDSFAPAVEAEFGKEKVLIVKDAVSGQPIRRWYRDWKPKRGGEPRAKSDLYDRLMKKVKAGIKGKKIASVTFVWMQGERDAKEKHGEVYEKSLKGLIDQVEEDLGQEEVNFVIGRLSDFDLKNRRYHHWTKVRKAQEKVVKGSDRGALVNTDDLNDGVNRRGKEIKNDLHYFKKGYEVLGERFAKEAIKLIKRHKN